MYLFCRVDSCCVRVAPVRAPSIRSGLRFLAAAVGLGTAVVGFEHDAAAQTIPTENGKGFDTHLFRPALDSKGFFHTNGTDVLGANDLSLGLVIDYGHGLLRTADKGQESTNLIDHSFKGSFSFNYGFANFLVAGVTLPIQLMSGEAQTDRSGAPAQTGPLGNGTPNGTQWRPELVDFQNAGFIALHAKARILRVERGFGLAVAAQVGVPIADAPQNGAGDPGFWYWPQVIGEKRFGSTGQFRIGLNAGFRGHAVSDTIIDLKDGRLRDGNRVTYGLGLSYRVLPALDLVADTYGTYLLSDAASKIKPSNEVTGGIKVFVERNSYLLLGGGPRYTQGFEAADIRAFIGFIFEPSIGDRDGDGIKDDVDKCPDDPEDFDGFQDEDGCPDPDNDNDGILDKDDRCPNEPEDRDGDQDEDGCPEGDDGDRDGDGILDSKDKCPDDPEDKDGFEDEDGCPDPDNDKDGIPDKKDQCPNDPEDKDGFEDEDGCPDPDNDKDGILDVVDKCPNEPETFNGFEDEDGCPDKGLVVIDKDNILILKKIKFRTNSAEILPESNEILDAVATTLLHHPEFTLIEVAGHADERATDAYNLRLTQDRVNSVMAGLVARKVNKSTLRAKGYGEFCPEDPGHNEEAWEKNRRVEFKIVKTKEGPTGVELGCANASSKGVNPEPVPN
ncbi:MAG: OmpA family protein [Labilithrix sp.]|nr:OmpA family protein [Labilithrix sp.]MCW5818195.1 OmpA family protein [Labilithrix sp.]